MDEAEQIASIRAYLREYGDDTCELLQRAVRQTGGTMATAIQAQVVILHNTFDNLYPTSEGEVRFYLENC